MLDVGIYGLSFASFILGQPTNISGLANIGPTGIDEQCSIVLRYDGAHGGTTSILSFSQRSEAPREALIAGNKGYIRVLGRWHQPAVIELTHAGKTEQINLGFESNGLQYEAIEVMKCIRLGKLESDIMPLSETLAIMQTMDTLRKQWGVVYPTESKQ